MKNTENEGDEEKLAKRFFLDYGGSSFFMYREGVLDAYRKYGIGREKEAEWAKEEIERLLNVFVGNCPQPDLTYCSLLRYIQLIGDIDELRNLFQIVRSNMADFDTVTLVLFAEKTFQLMKDSKYSKMLNQKDLQQEEFNLIKELLTRARTMKFRVGKAFLQDHFWKGNFTEERIKERIRVDYGQLESYLLPPNQTGGFWKWISRRLGWSS